MAALTPELIACERKLAIQPLKSFWGEKLLTAGVVVVVEMLAPFIMSSAWA